MDLKRTLAAVRGMLAGVAAWTSNTFDDKAVGFLDALIASDELLDWFKGLLASDMPPEAMASVQLPDRLAIKLPDPGQAVEFVAFVKTLIEFVRMFFPKD